MNRLSIAPILLLMMAAAARADVPSNPSDAAAQSTFRLGVASRKTAPLARVEFRRAAELYAAVSERDGETPARRRMEGQAWFLAGDLPRAIHAYRRGLMLDPDDGSIQRGLDLARQRVAYGNPGERLALSPPDEPYPLMHRPLRRFGLIAIAVINVAGFIGVGRWITDGRRRWLIVGIAGLTLSLAIAIAWFMEWNERSHRNRQPFGIVTHSQVLRRGDGLSFLPRRDLPLPAGAEVRVLQRRGEWLQVELADGTAGWLPRAGLLVELK